MSMHYIDIGPSPYDEECVNVGEDDYTRRALQECRRFILLLREVLGPEPEGARLTVRAFPHDFGDYYEVVCTFDPTLPASLAYAMRCEAECPAHWEDQA